jgi:hypothetical protein
LSESADSASLERVFGDSELALRKNPSQVGALSELAVATALWRAGFDVFTPFFCAHSRIDLLYLNAKGVVRRVQCKTAKLERGFVSFWTCSNTGGERKTYAGEVDEFGVYCRENDTVYLVPISEVPSRSARLRIEPPRSNQSVGVRWAEPYRLGSPATPAAASSADDAGVGD